MTLILNSTPVAFGAVGVAFLEAVSTVVESVTALGGNVAVFQAELALQVGIIHGLIGTFIPLLSVAILTIGFGGERSIKPVLQVLPFAILGGLSFTVPYFLCGLFLTPELPSIIGGLVGLTASVTAAKLGFLVPTTM